MNSGPSLLLGAVIAVGLALGGWFAGDGLVRSRALERTVEVKGLAERELPADTAIWPLRLMVAGDDLEALLLDLEGQARAVRTVLGERGFSPGEITTSAPDAVDRHAQMYGDPNVRFRYVVAQVITVFTPSIAAVRDAGRELSALGKAGIVLNQTNFEDRTQYLFNGLNDIKPAMIEEATRNAREVAQKFAEDSASRLGKIRTARQGQFTIEDRDSNNPHIKRVRVVSTVEYYLSD
jgi:hypothetical protein